MHYIDEEDQQNNGSQDIDDDNSSSVPEYHVAVISSKNESTKIEDYQILESIKKTCRRCL